MQKQVTLSAGIKFILLCVMALALLIPQLLIDGLVSERSLNAYEARSDIASSWGQEQTVAPPHLRIPFVERNVDGNRTSQSLLLYPDTLRIRARLTTEQRQRSVYKAVLYKAFITIEGEYRNVSASVFPKDAEHIEWGAAEFVQVISDEVGIKSPLHLLVNGQTCELLPIMREDSHSSGAVFTASVPVEPGQPYRYSISYELNGSSEILFSPEAKETQVDLHLEWGTPSFTGRFLPDEREVSDSLTTASWNVLHANTSMPMQRIAPLRSRGDDGWYEIYDGGMPHVFGVRTLVQNDHYRMVSRSVKYAILMIVFTFMTFFFSDSLASDGRIPLLAYLLTGLAILLFYTLLLSISEYLAFGYAFLLASAPIVLMISVYLWSFVRKILPMALCAGILSSLYIFLYIILQMENFPLLVGSIFLFVILAILMFLSRRLDWRV